MTNDNFDNPEYWGEKWSRHIENYLAAPPRCGIWMHKTFRGKKFSVLEAAGGSCRDSRYLFELGYQAVGSDFDQRTLEYIRKKFRDSSFKVFYEDAFHFSYKDNEFDVVFNNGFWVLFDDDNSLIDLLKEQARVSKKYAFVLVHNIKNEKLVETFNKKSNQDDLYSIRFFDKTKLKDVLKRSKIKYKGYRFEKFGGPVDRLYALERRLFFISPIVRWLVPRLYRIQPWTKVERIVLVVEL